MGSSPKDPELPRQGFTDPERLAELQRQARQRMEQEERAAGVSPPSTPRSSGRSNATVYGAPAYTGPPPQSETRPPAPVYGGPPMPVRRGIKPVAILIGVTVLLLALALIWLLRAPS